MSRGPHSFLLLRLGSLLFCTRPLTDGSAYHSGHADRLGSDVARRFDCHSKTPGCCHDVRILDRPVGKAMVDLNRHGRQGRNFRLPFFSSPAVAPYLPTRGRDLKEYDGSSVVPRRYSNRMIRQRKWIEYSETAC